MNIWGFIFLLFVLGFLFRFGMRSSRIGWLAWGIPLVLYGLLQMGQVEEADAFLAFYLLMVALGGLLCGLAIRFHKFFSVRR